MHAFMLYSLRLAFLLYSLRLALMHTGRSSSGLGQSQAPGYTPLSSGTLGENTRQPTHNKLTTEPAKDPLKKDICKSYFSMFVTIPTGFLHYRRGIATISTGFLHYSRGAANV